MKPNRGARKIDETTPIPIDDGALDAMIAQARGPIERAMKRYRRPEARVGVMTSPLGRLLVAESDAGLAAIHFLFLRNADRTLELLRKKFDLIENESSTKRVSDQIERYFAGDLAVMENPVDLALVESEFQRHALLQLRKIPAGAVITYQALAVAIGHPDSQRAIGNTMASNPVAIVVPCHRVIRSDGTIGNYGGGVENKLKLLRVEGFEVGDDLRLPQGAVMGHRTTKIFCNPDCSAAKRTDSSRQLIFADISHAQQAGLRACKLCNPT